MSGFWTVIQFTCKENIKKKSFIVSTVLMLALTVLAFSMPRIIDAFSNSGKASESSDKESQDEKSTVYMIDENGIFTQDLALLEKTFEKYAFKTETLAALDTLKEEIRESTGNAIVVVHGKDGLVDFEYFVEKYGKSLDPKDLGKELRTLYTNKLLQSAQVSQTIIDQITGDISYTVSEMGVDSASGSIFGIVLSLLLFLSIYLFGYGVAMSVASEKTSRVMELLVTSTKPSIIIVGKTVAMGLIGLGQFVLVLLTGYISYQLNSSGGFSIGDMNLDLSVITPFVLVMMIVYFIIGYFLFAFMNAVAGATVSKAEDVQSALMPINMIAVLGFYFAYFTVLTDSSGQLAVIASIVPLSAPFSMPIRILIGGVPIWQIFTSLSALTVFTVFMAWISIRLYSAAVLHYGNKINLIELFNMSKKK